MPLSARRAKPLNPGVNVLCWTLAVFVAATMLRRADAAVEPVPRVTDAMMLQFVEIQHSLPADASQADQDAAAAKTTLGVSEYRYIQTQVEVIKREMKKAEAEANGLKNDADAQSAMVNAFTSPQAYEELAKRLPAQGDALRERAAILA